MIKTKPEANEILVKKVFPLRFAGGIDAKTYDSFFEHFNASMAGH